MLILCDRSEFDEARAYVGIIPQFVDENTELHYSVDNTHRGLPYSETTELPCIRSSCIHRATLYEMLNARGAAGSP
jgi:hypothetical protein